MVDMAKRTFHGRSGVVVEVMMTDGSEKKIRNEKSERKCLCKCRFKVKEESGK